MKSLAQIPLSDFALVILSGSERGTSYRLIAGRVSIGRGSENDISIKDDPKISRNHAVIQVTPHGIEISDVSDRNKVVVNGEEVTSRVLIPGALIQLGDTKFQLKQLPSSAATKELAAQNTQSMDLYDRMDAPARRPSGSRRPRQKKSNSFYFIVAIIALVFIWLLTSNTKKTVSPNLRTQQDVELTIQGNNKLIESLQAERDRQGLGNRQYEEAQPNFVKGFRDYRKGQYDRAIESLQACLSLYPEHPQCQRYLKLAQKKFSELIQYHMVLGNKYRAQNQFSACMSAYRNAMVMIKNTTDKTYLEAKSGHEACELLSGERY
jgi:pSer/pThr/pTyr-binding forkhead associated (FHA) protein